MKIRAKIIFLISIVFAMSCLTIQAQQQPATGSGYKLIIMNDKQVSEKVFEFDLYLQATDPTVPFRFAALQAGIMVNPAILNGGTITPAFIPGTSELVDYQQPRSIQFSADCIKMFTSPGKVGQKPSSNDPRGSLISTTSPGTRICRIRISNSVEFGKAPANLEFSFQIRPYATKIAQYLNNINTELPITEQNCLVRTDNKPLNPVIKK